MMTPVSYIYAIGSEDFNPIKIGYSSCPKGRLWALQNATPYKLGLLGVWGPWKRNEIRFVESVVHNLFKDKRLRGEWFDVSIDAIKKSLYGYEEYTDE